MYVTDNTGRRYRLATKEEEARIREGIAADPDSRELTDEEIAELRPLTELKRAPGRPKAETPKERVTIRLSPEVTAYFRAAGKGWQTRLDEVLKAYVAARR